MRPETLEDRLLKRIDRKRDVFLRADFGDLAATTRSAASCARSLARGVW
jgi:hypothetical protein